MPTEDWNAASDGPLAPAATTSTNPQVAAKLASAPAAVTTTDTTDTGAAGELDGLTPQADTNLAKTATTATATTLTSGATWYFIYLTGYTQERSNWCGPAAARTMLSTWLYTPPSQSALATQMGTNTLGFTSPTAMSKALNQRINVSYPGFGTAYTTYRSITNQNLWDGVTRYHRGEVWGLTVRSRAIWYPSAPSAEAHYLVIYGYSNNYRGIPAYIVWDPVPQSQGGGVHTIAKADWQRVAYPGQFVVAPSYG